MLTFFAADLFQQKKHHLLLLFLCTTALHCFSPKILEIKKNWNFLTNSWSKLVHKVYRKLFTKYMSFVWLFLIPKLQTKHFRQSQFYQWFKRLSENFLPTWKLNIIGWIVKLYKHKIIFISIISWNSPNCAWNRAKAELTIKTRYTFED